ncbi:hypothetical protein G6F70_006237 [Rhizopus microsporus]|nr:hypothetical protein G6F71_001869 [Rhizopus microsporus]KAG1197915.1 hypothetical protein G6F70_006237 [Rhizopus microsporus]KAG1209652.1 hypothetical protein G6F69_006161 [Rhizopus microsporus]KAG1231078.1 hypothetical protein G6F67_006004 [Rhizopus microsporus]KAG1263414.1 hypothetical protein G6F68_005173 [Rhizopus microsporus]
MRSGLEWARKVELKNREAAGIQQAYSEVPAVDFVNSSELLKYLWPSAETEKIAKEVKRTVIAYGDASLTGTKARYAPIPVKKVQRASAQRALVVPVDELRTGVTCSKCCQCLKNKYERQRLVRKKKVRLKEEKNATLRCLDDNKRIVCRTLECSQREPSSYLPVIYQLKHCQLCPAANDRDIVWQRDINAALNIRSILVSYGINLWWCSSHFTATLIGPVGPLRYHFGGDLGVSCDLAR